MFLFFQSTENQRSALLKAAQLEEQLQDLREHADLLEFRCLELEDSNEKVNFPVKKVFITDI